MELPPLTPNQMIRRELLAERVCGGKHVKACVSDKSGKGAQLSTAHAPSLSSVQQTEGAVTHGNTQVSASAAVIININIC